MYKEFTCIELFCAGCPKDKILAYDPPKEPGARYEGQFRAYKVGENTYPKFHTEKPPPGTGTESSGVLLVQEMV